MSLFGQKSKPKDTLRTLIAGIHEFVSTGTSVNPSLMESYVSNEAMSSDTRTAITDSYEDFLTNIASAAASANMVDSAKVSTEDLRSRKERRAVYSETNVKAAAAAGFLASNPRAMLGFNPQRMVSTESLPVVNMPMADSVDGRSVSLEAFDERENRAIQTYSMAYNFIATQQDEFGEAFFRTIVTPPDNPGFIMEAPLMMVYDDVVRDISGRLDNYNKKNIIRAFADATILKNDMTRIVPVVSPTALENFVDASIIPPYYTDRDGEEILTAPLKIGQEFSLLGISQAQSMLAAGANDLTDTIDTAVTLAHVYVKIGDDIFKFNTAALPTSVFTYSVQHNYRRMALDFVTSSVLINKDTKTTSGLAPTTLGAVVSGDLIIRLALKMNGSVNLELADTSVFANKMSVAVIRDAATGLKVPTTSGPGKAIADLIAGGEVLGYDLLAYRTNINRRQRGQLVDTTIQRQAYNIPLRSPVTIPRPTNTDGSDDSDLRTLITVTRARTSNAAVTALLNAYDILRSYVDARDDQGVPPEVLGVSRYLVTPVCFSEHINVLDHIDSIRSHERKEDVQAVLVNKIRDYAYRMYRDSLYKAAADALSGGQAPIPTVIIGTDPVISRYLTVTGDLRTLGNDFDVRIVSTLDSRMRGRIAITFGDMATNSSEPTILGFGNMIWSSEMVIGTALTRNGAVVRELAVSPRFIHIPNLPVLTMLTVEGIEDVFASVPVKFKDVL